jgi:integrase
MRGNWIRAIGPADDFEDADSTTILDFWQAQEKARSIARENRDGAKSAEPTAVGQALDRYEADLKTRGGDLGSVTRVRAHLTKPLAGKMVPQLTVRDLRSWRDSLVDILAPATVNRTCAALKAALNLAADQDERIVSRRAWEIGLATIPDAERSRNIILDDKTVRTLIAEAHAHSPQFGLLVEVAAITGARVSQLARLEVQDLQCGPAPRLMMPASRKGRRTKVVLRRPVPISPGLGARLKTGADGRGAMEPLLKKASGTTWGKSDHTRLFARAATRAGAVGVTIYALRHSSMVRQLLAGVPIRVVAVNHDTSVGMLERTYSRHITDHADAMTRGALLEGAHGDG